MRLSSKHQKDSIWMKLMHRQTPGFYQMQRLSTNGTMLCHSCIQHISINCTGGRRLIMRQVLHTPDIKC